MTNPKEVKKEPYQEPKVIDYGNIADLTKQAASHKGGVGTG
jgi:hypothetical protein